MRLSRRFAAGLLALPLVLAFATPGTAYKRQELRKYKEKNLTATDFTLKDLKGKTYSLKDYRDRMWVVLETGSST